MKWKSFNFTSKQKTENYNEDDLILIKLPPLKKTF